MGNNKIFLFLWCISDVSYRILLVFGVAYCLCSNWGWYVNDTISCVTQAVAVGHSAEPGLIMDHYQTKGVGDVGLLLLHILGGSIFCKFCATQLYPFDVQLPFSLRHV